jgi:chromosome partitioning protein
MPSLSSWLKSEGKPAQRLAGRFLKFWEGLRRGGRFPLIAELNLDDIDEFVPYTFNLDISYDTENPTFRFVGFELARECGGDLVHKELSVLPPRCLLAHALRHRGQVIAQQKPFTVADEFTDTQGSKRLYRAVMLPFSRTGDRIDYIIGAVSGKSVGSLATANAPAGQPGAEGTKAEEDRRVPADARKAEEERPAAGERRDASELIADVTKAMAGEAASGPSASGPSSAESGASGPSPHLGGPGPRNKGHLIVLGSAKGGTGKSTTAMHLVVSLLYQGHTVATIDLDSPQRTLSRYIENRQARIRQQDLNLPVPRHLTDSDHAIDPKSLETDLRGLLGACDYVVVDTPGSVTPSSRMAHARADTLITPVNDSFVDLDTLAVLDADTLDILRPGYYAEMAVQARKQKAALSGLSSDWIVLRNRLSNLEARNKNRMADALAKLSTSLGFRNVSGLSERVIYRELFLMGLTLLDLHEQKAGVALSMSHVAARQELRSLLDAIGPALETERRQATATAN